VNLLHPQRSGGVDFRHEVDVGLRQALLAQSFEECSESASMERHAIGAGMDVDVNHAGQIGGVARDCAKAVSAKSARQSPVAEAAVFELNQSRAMLAARIT
jgi:hypothetical protein